MSTALDYVRYSCGIAGEEVAMYVDELKAQLAKYENLEPVAWVVSRAMSEDKLEWSKPNKKHCLSSIPLYALEK